MFKCSFCGKEYENALDRAKCEIECDKANKAKIEAERQNKLKAEKAKRIEEIDKAYAEYLETCKSAKEKYLKIAEQYNKDYGVTAYNSCTNVYPTNYFQDFIDKLFRL